jgi:FAD/FMN-containing dehydrogenase
MRHASEIALRRVGIDYDGVPASLVARAVEPGDAAYHDVRSTYLRGGSPGLVLRPSSTQEVAAAVVFAARQPVAMSTRSGGHGVSGRSTNDGGIVIDVGALATIEVLDMRTRRIRVGPGAIWTDVADALEPWGWALSSGDNGGVGVGGVATAGGIGLLVRNHGLTIDHLRSVEVVLADGSVVTANHSENADLFWAVRGAGANFGIVTSFEFEADDVGAVGLAQLVFDASDTAGFLERWASTVEASPRDLTSFLSMGAPRWGKPALAHLTSVVDSDNPDIVLDRLRPLAELASLLQQSVQIVPYASVMANAHGGPHHGGDEPRSRSGLIEHITVEFAQAAAGLIASGEVYFFQIRSVGGAVADVAPDATAYAHRSANFSVVAVGSPQLDDMWDDLREHFAGLYLSFEADQRPERLAEAFPPATLARLRDIKQVYDPANVFRDNFPLVRIAR